MKLSSLPCFEKRLRLLLLYLPQNTVSIFSNAPSGSSSARFLCDSSTQGMRFLNFYTKLLARITIKRNAFEFCHFFCGGYAVIIGIRESFCHNRHRHQFCYGKNSGNSHDSLSCCLFMTFITPIYYNECHCVATRHHHGQKITHFLLGHKRKQHQLRRRPQQCKCVRTAQKSQLFFPNRKRKSKKHERSPYTRFHKESPVIKPRSYVMILPRTCFFMNYILRSLGMKSQNQHIPPGL